MWICFHSSWVYTDERHPSKIPWRREWQPAPVFLLENSMDRGARWATVHGVKKSWTQLSNSHTHTHTHTYDLFLTLRRTGRLFSKVTAPFYIPADSVWGLQFFHIHPNTYLSFDCNHPSGCEMLSLWSCFAFLWKLMLSVFSCLLATCITYFEEMVLCQIFS